MRWFTADLHFGHGNVITYCSRPFAGVAQMDSELIARWNARVAPDDEVVVAGDFALGHIGETLSLASELHGRKVLVSGNHDRCWDGHGSRATEWTDRYLEAGFAEVLQGAARTGVGDRQVLVCHFPYHGDSQARDRHLSHRPPDDGRTVLLHGHVHEKWKVRGRQINVGVDVWNYRPVSERELAPLVARAGA